MKKENGFTLVEILVALFIGSLMMVAIYSVVNSAQRSSTGIERKVLAPGCAQRPGLNGDGNTDGILQP